MHPHARTTRAREAKRCHWMAGSAGQEATKQRGQVHTTGKPRPRASSDANVRIRFGLRTGIRSCFPSSLLDANFGWVRVAKISPIYGKP
jgi:hypothetical protein